MPQHAADFPFAYRLPTDVALQIRDTGARPGDHGLAAPAARRPGAHVRRARRRPRRGAALRRRAGDGQAGVRLRPRRRARTPPTTRSSASRRPDRPGTGTSTPLRPDPADPSPARARTAAGAPLRRRNGDAHRSAGPVGSWTATRPAPHPRVTSRRAASSPWRIHPDGEDADMARIPLDPPRTALYRLAEWYARRTYGVVPDPLPAMAHNMRVLSTDLRFEMSLARWKRLDPTLKALAVMASAVVDRLLLVRGLRLLGDARNRGIDPRKMRDVPRWRDSDVYTDLERQVMAYAEAVTATPPEVTDEMVAGPAAPAGRRGAGRAHHDGGRGERPVAVQQRPRADQPGLHGPLRDPGGVVTDRTWRRSTGTGGCCSASPTRCWAASPTPRTSSRTRGCAGRRPTGTTSSTSAPTSCRSPPGWRWTGWARRGPGGRATSGRGCRSRC